MLQHRNPNRRSYTTETKIWATGSSQQRNPCGKLKCSNLPGREILGKLGFTLSQNKGTIINTIQSDNAIQIKIIKQFPTYAPVWANLKITSPSLL